MVYKYETFWDDNGIVVLQTLKVSHLCIIPNRLYEPPNLKNWMCELCTFSQIQSQNYYDLASCNILLSLPPLTDVHWLVMSVIMWSATMITSNGDNNMCLRKNSSRSANTGLLLLLLNYYSLMINDATRIIRIQHNVHNYSALICTSFLYFVWLSTVPYRKYEHSGSYDVNSLLGCHSISSRLACCYN